MKRGKEHITARQLTVMIILYIIGSAILYIPSSLATASKQNAWIAAIVGTMIALGLMWWFVQFSKLYPDNDFIECCELAFGKWMGKFIGILYLIFPTVLAALILWNIGDFTVTQIIPDTPINAILIMFMFVVIYGARHGLEPIFRTGEVFIPWVLGLFTLIILLLIPVIELKNMSPLLEGGIRSILAGSYQIIGFPFFELVTFLMIIPHLDKKDNTKKALMTGTAIGGLVLSIITLYCILILGPDFTGRNTFPTYVIGKKISIGDFLERIEIIIAIIWFLSIYFKLAITFYAVCIGLAKIFSLQDYRPLTFPLGMLIVSLTLIMIPSTIFLINFNTKVWTLFSATFALVIPFIVYIRLKVIKKKNNQLTGQSSQTSHQ